MKFIDWAPPWLVRAVEFFLDHWDFAVFIHGHWVEHGLVWTWLYRKSFEESPNLELEFLNILWIYDLREGYYLTFFFDYQGKGPMLEFEIEEHVGADEQGHGGMWVTRRLSQVFFK